MRRFLWLIIGVPAAVLLILFSVANRGAVTVRFDPFSAEAPAAALTLPLFVFLFASLIIGLILGGFSVWLSQARYRRAARAERARAERTAQEAQAQRERADQLAAEKIAGTTPSRLVNHAA